MKQTAKIFMNGRSQAVRIPKEFRFETDEVYISKDPKTGHIILSQKPNNWIDFLNLVRQHGVPDDFLSDRDNDKPQERDLF